MIGELFSAIGGFMKGNDYEVSLSRKSISRGSANSIFHFPVLYSNTLPVEALEILTKALEAEYVSMLRIMMSLDDTISLAHNPKEAKLNKLRNLHQNYDGQGNMEFSVTGTFMEQQAFIEENIRLLKPHENTLNLGSLNEMTENLNEGNYYNFGILNEKKGNKNGSIPDSNVPNNLIDNISSWNGRDKRTIEDVHKMINTEYEQQKKYFSRDDYKKKGVDITDLRIAVDKKLSQYKGKVVDTVGDNGEVIKGVHNGREKVREYELLKRTSSKLRKVEDEINKELSKKTTGDLIDDKKLMKSKLDNVKLARDLAAPNLVDMTGKNEIVSSEVKKANESAPTLFTVSVWYDNKAGSMVKTELMVGVKAVAHIIPADEILENVASATKQKRGFFGSVRPSAGEVESFRQYMFATNQIKEHIRKDSKQSAWWGTLRDRAYKSALPKVRFNGRGSKDTLPNATLVISMSECEFIKANYNIDLLKNSTAIKNMFDTYFLLGFVIVDYADELMYVIYDGRSKFEVHTFNSMANNTKKAQGDMKTILSLMNNSR